MTRRYLFPLGVASALALLLAVGVKLNADPPGPPAPEPEQAVADEGIAMEAPAGAIKHPGVPLWVDPKKKVVYVDGFICVTKGYLEVFACVKGSKQHESVVAINAKPSQVHTALLAIGAKQGTPVQFQPEYKPPTGNEIDVFVIWKDDKGVEHKVRGQELVRAVKTKKHLEAPWVFAGSGFWHDEQTGQQIYKADQGEFICLSNFPSATLDLPIESTNNNENLMFEAFTEKLPPTDTKVRLMLAPKGEKGKAAG